MALVINDPAAARLVAGELAKALHVPLPAQVDAFDRANLPAAEIACNELSKQVSEALRVVSLAHARTWNGVHVVNATAEEKATYKTAREAYDTIRGRSHRASEGLKREREAFRARFAALSRHAIALEWEVSSDPDVPRFFFVTAADGRRHQMEDPYRAVARISLDNLFRWDLVSAKFSDDRMVAHFVRRGHR